MRALALAVILSMTGSPNIGAEPVSDSGKPIKAGMSFTEANTILSGVGLHGYPPDPGDSISLDQDLALQQFPINRNVVLWLSYSKTSGLVRALGLETTPTYRPVKGLEVQLPLLSIKFDTDRSYVAHFESTNKSK
jgi:hypothetical protein